MEVVEKIWEILGVVFGGLLKVVERAITSLFGSSNVRYLRRLQPKVDAINSLEPRFQGMSDSELKQQTDLFRQRLSEGETLDDLLIEAFAACREAGRRFLGMRHYDVQLLGGMVLHSGSIAEMITGEGKTLVATLPAYLNALEKKGVHVVTVNNYLARRDMEWMAPIYMGLGLTVGAIYSDQDPREKQQAYDRDITYGTNNEFGFDYLRDNMRRAAKGDDRYDKHQQQCQPKLNYAIVDEIDNILIDEARTPLIISGPAHDDVTRYARADKVARQLTKDLHFEVKEKEHTVLLTDEGIRDAEKLAGVESFYTAGNMDWPHLIDNSLKAHYLYKRDVNYVVQGDEVIIVDEFTGRLMPGRQWSDGLHQAVEAKEGVKIKQETQTYATITLQNYFKLYNKVCGMTGTAMTEANEFWKIYQLDVIAIPSNRKMQRLNMPDVIYRTEREKYNAIVEEIETLHKWDEIALKDGTLLLGTVHRESETEVAFESKENRQKENISREKIDKINFHGRPILVGTVSIEKSEKLSAMLSRRGIPHQVLNAKHHQREAEIVAQAGRKNAVTIATNMAGRGTDIILGGNPETMAWAQLQSKYPTRLEVPQEEWNSLVQEIEQREKMKPEGEEVRKLGGLHIIGTERHEARRIDLQLRGRCGRQGDPGSSVFYLSLEDDLMRIFAGEWVKNVLTRMGMQEGEAIVSSMVSRRIEGAQKKVEERNFEVRKSLLEYDEVMDEQRKRVYGFRQQVLDGVNCKEKILEMLEEQVERHLDEILAKDYGAETFAKWAGSQLGVELDGGDFRGADYATAERLAKDAAERMVETQVFDAVEENLPDDADPSEWSWEALTKFANTRWKLSLNDRQLRKLSRNEITEMLLENGREFVHQVDLNEGARALDPDYGRTTACGWGQLKFGLEIEPEEVQGLETAALKKFFLERARKAYDDREVEYPVMAGLYHFTSKDSSGQKRYDREGLVVWAKERFQIDLSLEDLKSKQREEVEDLLVSASQKWHETGICAIHEAQKLLEKHFDSTAASASSEDTPEHGTAGRNGTLGSLVDWLSEHTRLPLSRSDLSLLEPEILQRKVLAAVEDYYHPEIRRMERALVLELLDSTWKEHLLAMDHLRDSVRLRGYAQVDPKVEYKREGMRLFENMWSSVGERVTDLLFRMEQLDEGFVGSTWVQSQATHEAPPSSTHMGSSEKQDFPGNAPSEDNKPEPYRNRTDHVGRNDPCPCGSGKKYKKCCIRRNPPFQS